MPRRSNVPSIPLQEHLEKLAAARVQWEEQMDVERELRYTERWEASDRAIAAALGAADKAITAALAASEKSATEAVSKDRRLSDQVTLIADIQNRGTGRSSGTAQGWAYVLIGASLFIGLAGLVVAILR